MANAVDHGWLERLDAATDYKALFESVFGAGHHVSGDELWAKCPVHDDCDDPGKFSINLKDGKWGCFKHDEHGSMIGLMKATAPKSWRDKWVNACPRAKDVFGMEERKSGGPDSTRQDVDHSTIARDGALATSDEDLAPLATAWGIDVHVLRKQGWFVLRGGKEGSGHPKYCLPILNEHGKTCGIRIRFLPPFPTVKGKDGVEKQVKSRVMYQSTVGLFGLDQLSAVGTDGQLLPIVVVEGEKDFAVTSAELGERFAVISPSHGSGTSMAAFVGLLRDRDVTVLYDEDEAGNKGSRNLLTLICGTARSCRWAHIGQPGKDVFNVVRDDGGGQGALLGILDSAAHFTMEEALKDVAAVIKAKIPDDEPPDVVDISNHIFNVLSDAGALWLKTRNGEGYCVFDGRVYATENSDPGWALRIGEWTGIDSFGSVGARIHRQLAALACEKGQACDTTAWYARVGEGVCLPLCDQKQQLVEILPTGFSIKPNGHGGVVVLPSQQMRPIAWIENFDEKAAMVEWARFLNLFTCSNQDRRLIEALLLMLPLYDWVDTHPIVRFSGAPGSGKSTAAKLITVLLYGDERLFTATNAAMYRMGVNLPLIVLDNIEADGVDENLELFFLLAATGAEKVKSAMDSASRVVVERVRSWVLTTGVDPITFGKRELVERSLIIPFGVQGSDGFMPRAAMTWVRENRDLLWNLIFRRVWQSICSLKDGGMERVVASIDKEHRPRLREFYALASIVLGQDLKADDEISFLLGEHVDDENTASVEDNPLVDLLSFMPAFLKTQTGQQMGVHIGEQALGWQTEWVQAQRLSVVLSSIARIVGRPYPFRSTQQMTVRLGLVRKQLETLGLKIERNENVLVEGKRLRAWRFFIPKHLGRSSTLFGEDAVP